MEREMKSITSGNDGATVSKHKNNNKSNMHHARINNQRSKLTLTTSVVNSH